MFTSNMFSTTSPEASADVEGNTRSDRGEPGPSGEQHLEVMREERGGGEGEAGRSIVSEKVSNVRMV